MSGRDTELLCCMRQWCGHIGKGLERRRWVTAMVAWDSARGRDLTEGAQSMDMAVPTHSSSAEVSLINLGDNHSQTSWLLSFCSSAFSQVPAHYGQNTVRSYAFIQEYRSLLVNTTVKYFSCQHLNGNHSYYTVCFHKEPARPQVAIVLGPF